MFEPLASTQLPASPSAGILTLDHLTSSGVAAIALEESVPGRLSSIVSARVVEMICNFAKWRSLSPL